MPNHDEELKRFFNTPPPGEDAEFERWFELVAQELTLEVGSSWLLKNLH